MRKKILKQIKWSVYAICLAAFIGLLPGASLTARAESETPATGTGTEEDPYVVYNWVQLKEKMEAGGFVTLGEDALDQEKSGQSYLYVPSGKEVVLDLNGHTIDRGLSSPLENGNVIRAEGNLTVKDSPGTGIITGGNTSYFGGGIYGSYATLTIQGGSIQNNTAGYGGSGIGLEGGAFSMEGGAVQNNHTENVGGGLYLCDVTGTMTGGIISNNTAYHGGGVYLEFSYLIQSGGEIKQNSASYIGGGVALDGSTFRLSESGSITVNTACFGGGIGSADENCRISVDGGSIKDNTATGNESQSFGGGIYSGDYCAVYLYGGVISCNQAVTQGSAVTHGGGIYTAGGQYSYYNIQGNPVVCDNTAGGITDNFYLYEGFCLGVAGALSEDASIGLTLAQEPTVDNPVVFTENYARKHRYYDPKNYFVSDNPKYCFLQNDYGEALLAVPREFELYIAGVQVTDVNAGDLTVIEGVIPQDNGYAEFNPDTNTLKLKDVFIGGGSDENADCAINYQGESDFKLITEGNCYICDTNKRKEVSGGLIVGKPGEWVLDPNDANLDIALWGGTLTLLGGTAEGGYYPTSYGLEMRNDGDLTIHGEGELIAKGGTATYSYGIAVAGGTVIFDEAPTVESMGANDVYYSSGIEGLDVNVKGGTIIGVGGNATVESHGISANGGWKNRGSFTISKGDVKAVSGTIAETGGYGIALLAEKEIAINGGILETFCQSATSKSKALSIAPTLAKDLKAAGSKKADGSDAVEYNATDNDTYKWFKCPFEVTPKKKVTEIFDDVKEGSWYVNAVQYVYDNSIMGGKGASFQPNAKISREEFVRVLYNHAGTPGVTIENPYADVKAGAWYEKAVLWAKEKDIANGKVKDGKSVFGVGANITREEMALMFYKYAKLNGYTLTKDDHAIDGFSDANLVSTWAKDAMNWAVSNGVMSGKAGNLDPKGNATRAECASMFKNMIEKTAK